MAVSAEAVDSAAADSRGSSRYRQADGAQVTAAVHLHGVVAHHGARAEVIGAALAVVAILEAVEPVETGNDGTSILSLY